MEMGKIGVGAEQGRLRAFPLTNGIVRLTIDSVNNNIVSSMDLKTTKNTKISPSLDTAVSLVVSPSRLFNLENPGSFSDPFGPCASFGCRSITL